MTRPHFRDHGLSMIREDRWGASAAVRATQDGGTAVTSGPAVGWPA
jgi:hypothetical protein